LATNSRNFKVKNGLDVTGNVTVSGTTGLTGALTGSTGSFTGNLVAGQTLNSSNMIAVSGSSGGTIAEIMPDGGVYGYGLRIPLTGGWHRTFSFWNNDRSTRLGAFGGTGTGNALSYLYAGLAQDSAYATKFYPDTGQVIVQGELANTLTTDATSWTTGAAKFSGGVGVAKNLYVGGKLVTSATSASRAGLNLPAGTAPSSPADGDVWTTTTGMYVRINGATVGPLDAGSGGGTWGSITGTLGDQTDLTTALGLKANLAGPTFTGTVTLPTLVGASTTDSSSSTTGAFKTAGGMGIAKKLYVGGASYFTGTLNAGSITATSIDLDITPTATAATLYYVGIGTPSDIQAKSLANVKAEVVTTASVNTAVSTGKITFFPTAGAEASINLPHGTAPSSPANGDVWTTTAGMYVRVNGSTVGPLSASATTAWGGITGTLSSQTDLNTALGLKANLAGPTFTGTVTLPSTTSIGNVSSAELGYLDGVTSAIQTQLGAKAPTASPSFTGTATFQELVSSVGAMRLALGGAEDYVEVEDNHLTAYTGSPQSYLSLRPTSLVVQISGAATTLSNTELTYLDGVTSPIQTQIDDTQMMNVMGAY
jgi:hypothetical protein